MADKLLMTDDELAVAFRTAKDKREQIQILADLNLCAPFTVAERLTALGELEDTGLHASQFSNRYSPIPGAPAKRGRPKKPKGAMPTPPLDELHAMELWNEGLGDAAMADALGVSVQRVRKWRGRMNLMRPRGGDRRKKKEEETEMKSDIVPERAADIPAPEPGERQAAPTEEPEQLLTVKEFLATVTELLTPAAAKASLYLNGAPVRSVAQIVIKSRGDAPCVDIVTEGGA